MLVTSVPSKSVKVGVGGVDDMIFSHKWFMKGVYTYKGTLSNATIGQKVGLNYRDLNLLLAARF